MEFLVLYMFVMIEQFAALLALGWAAFWGGLVVTALVAIISALCTESLSYGSSKPAVTWSDTFNSTTALAVRGVCKWFMIVGIVLGCLSYLIPTQKDLAIIVGGGITYQAVTSETGKRIGGKAISLLEEKIDSVLADKPAKKEAPTVKQSL